MCAEGRSLYISCPRLKHSTGNYNIILLVIHYCVIDEAWVEETLIKELNREEHNVGRAHVEDGDFNGDHVAGLVGGPGVVLLAEGHDVDALGTQGGPHRRRGRRLARLQRQLHDAHHCMKAETKEQGTDQKPKKTAIRKQTRCHRPKRRAPFLDFPDGLGGAMARTAGSGRREQRDGRGEGEGEGKRGRKEEHRRRREWAGGGGAREREAVAMVA
ncbi:hypothetical protein C4D60_Mb04t36920 [Musa balbisiana]|uniref:Uncharacterized protein n=1 Tax=Musa balbisiana TaxID=52838 RepID=A0A4S8KHH4_MUSBA|nr:hypothetical protein C4D60_Mb04t36920 [Musa balbisiana]